MVRLFLYYPISHINLGYDKTVHLKLKPYASQKPKLLFTEKPPVEGVGERNCFFLWE